MTDPTFASAFSTQALLVAGATEQHRRGSYIRWLEKRLREGRELACRYRDDACYKAKQEIDDWLQDTGGRAIP